MNYKFFAKLAFYIFTFVALSSCGKDFFKYSSAKENPVIGKERAKKNVEEGRGVNLGGLGGIGRSTTYEFSTSNPLWRASLDTLDFIPMATIDYSGGTIVSDWYTDGTEKNEAVKITVRFLSNEIRSDSVKVIIHKKKCNSNQTCDTILLRNSIIEYELRSSILTKAALLETEDKKKKKKK